MCRKDECSEFSFWALLGPQPQRTCATCLAAAAPAWLKRPANSSPEHNSGSPTHHARRAPVLIVPGFASSVLELHESATKPQWVGEAVWVTMGKLVGKLLSKKDSHDSPEGPSKGEGTPTSENGSFRVSRKSGQARLNASHPLVRHLTLAADGFSDPAGIKVRARGGIDAVMYLSSNKMIGQLSFVFGHVVQHLSDELGYATTLAGGPGRFRPSKKKKAPTVPEADITKTPCDTPLIAAAPYDWRIATPHLQTRDRFFSSMRAKIEFLFNTTGLRVVLLAHSMGCKVIFFFFPVLPV